MAATPGVDEFLETLDHPHADAARLLRDIVLSADEGVTEGIKWNVPSFRTGDWFATMNLRPSAPLRLVLHTGAKARPGHPSLTVDDPEKLLEWVGEDRAIIVIPDRAALEERREALVAVLRQWIPQLP